MLSQALRLFFVLPTGRKALRPARAAVAAAEAADFHWHIALADRARRMQGSTGFPRHWRWRVRRWLSLECSSSVDYIGSL